MNQVKAAKMIAKCGIYKIIEPWQVASLSNSSSMKIAAKANHSVNNRITQIGLSFVTY